MEKYIIDAHVPKNGATEEQENNQQGVVAAKMKVAEVHVKWQLFVA